MNKKLANISLVLIEIIFILTINIFLKITSNRNHIIGINFIILLNLILLINSFISINLIFRNFDLNNSKNFKNNLKIKIANSFFISSIISIIGALILYSFLKDFLEIFHIKQGIINHITFASKIWFVSSPFIGLEITIFKYFYKLETYKKTIHIALAKLFIYFILLELLYIKYKTNCIVYAKPICDIIFLPYYTKICFDLTLKS